MSHQQKVKQMPPIKITHDTFLVVLTFLLLTILEPMSLSAQTFRRGDVNGDTRQDLTDAVVTLGHLFLGSGPLDCDDAADVNDDGKIDISDPVRLLNHLFGGDAAPPAPYPGLGEDPTADALNCGAVDGCGSAPTLPLSFACGFGQTCVVLEDVELQAEPRFRNDAPALALSSDGSAHVIFSVAEGGYFGFHASRSAGGKWSTAPMTTSADGSPIPLATADLVVGADGTPQALVNSGDLHTRLWRLAGNTWDALEELPGLESGRNHTLARTTADCLLAAATTNGDGVPRLGVARRTTAWDFEPVAGERDALAPVLALSSEGAPFLAYWTNAGTGGWLLRWAGAEGPQDVLELGLNSLERSQLAFAVDSTATPHFLLSRPPADGVGGFAVEHVSRGVNTPWVVTEIAREEPRLECPQANVEGETCDFEHTSYHPLRVLVDARDRALVLFSRLHSRVRLVARCDGIGPVDPPIDSPQEAAAAAPPPPPPLCQWEGTEERNGDLLAAWIENGRVETTVLAPGVDPFSLDATVDAGGDLHIAMYEWKGAQGFAVRYLRVGAR